VNDLEALGTFEGFRLCDQCLFVEARVNKIKAGMADGLRKQSGSVHGEKSLSPIPE
jgi:hypothetical protein